MEKQYCEYFELDKNTGLCKYYKGNKKYKESCQNKCEITEAQELMQGNDRQPLVRKRGALRRR